jgi:hypothetical protein
MRGGGAAPCKEAVMLSHCKGGTGVEVEAEDWASVEETKYLNMNESDIRRWMAIRKIKKESGVFSNEIRQFQRS